MNRILFDTDVLIEFLRGNENVRTHIHELHSAHSLLAYTPVSEAEIFRGLRSNERTQAEMTLATFDCLDLNRAVGRRAGEYLKSYSRSHGLELPDALIAAAAAIHRYALCTFNWKHYPMSEISRHRI